MSLNMDVAVNMLARIEIAQLDGRWNQAVWGKAVFDQPQTTAEIVTDEFGQPVGTGTCRTAFCGAGWVVQNAGLRMNWISVTSELNCFVADEVVDGRPIEKVACDLLDIPYDDYVTTDEDGDDTYTELAYTDERWDEDGIPCLFAPGNTLDEMYSYTAAWMDEPDEAELRRLVALRIPQMQREAVAARRSNAASTRR